MEIIRNIRVFLASPGDVADERQALERVVAELNLVLGAEMGARLELIRWETHVRPAIGSDAQDVINTQVTDDFDVFVGIFWSRAGTPTPRATSGTIEEFDRAIALHTREPGSVEIMLFFKDQPLSPSQIDPEQLAQLNEFRRTARELGVLDRSFKGSSEFEQLARLSLANCMREILKKKPGTGRTVHHMLPAPDLADAPESGSTDDLNDPDLGFLDADEIALEAMSAFEVVAQQMGDASTEMTERIGARAKELRSSIGDPRASKKIVEQAASDVTEFATTIERLLPSLHGNLERTLIATARGLTIRMADLDVTSSHIESLLQSITALETNMDHATHATRELRDTMASNPRTTINFNRAKRRAVLVWDRVLEEFALGKRLLNEVRRTTSTLPE